ncbi:MAG: sodium ion-translocating decarboxylase subunit beta, partial [bacterium]|nr:sodium ion-translocating decarboxylase subunit beta [bacterium]
MNEYLQQFVSNSGFGHFQLGNAVMIAVGLVFIYLAIKKDFEPLLLVPIGFGILAGNIPFPEGMGLGFREQGSVLSIFYDGVLRGWYPPLIFLGIGAMTDFSALLSNPRLLFLGAAAQAGIFVTLIGALLLGFSAPEAGAIGIIGGADGPTAIFLSSKLAPPLLGAIAISAYSYMALVPIIQPPIIKLLTTRQERGITMKRLRPVNKTEKILFPIAGGLVVCML